MKSSANNIILDDLLAHDANWIETTVANHQIFSNILKNSNVRVLLIPNAFAPQFQKEFFQHCSTYDWRNCVIGELTDSKLRKLANHLGKCFKLMAEVYYLC